MPNLMLTTACCLRCPYCFGMDMMSRHEASFMEFDLFLEILDWVRKGEEPYVALMGGEPTLHPRFEDFVDHLASEPDFRFRIFTNLAARRLGHAVIEQTRTAQARFVVNVNPEERYSPPQLATLHDNLTRIGDNALLTFNLTPDQFAFEPVLDLVDRFGLQRKIKVGVTIATLSRTNEYVTTEAMDFVAERLWQLFETCVDRDVHLDFECGVPECVLPSGRRNELRTAMGLNAINGCGRLLDISPDGEVFHCLPLYTAGAFSFRRFADIRCAREHFTAALQPFWAFGRGAECLRCEESLAHRCHGGCLVEPLSAVEGFRVADPPARPTGRQV